MDFIKVDYEELNAKQQENYNYHKVASALADYGFDSMRLSNDWQGADFIAVKGDNMLKVQLKGRFTVAKKYIGKDIFIAFLEKGTVKIYNHDNAVESLTENILSSKSWRENGLYSWKQTPLKYDSLIHLL